jgi:hypothetical protein
MSKKKRTLQAIKKASTPNLTLPGVRNIQIAGIATMCVLGAFGFGMASSDVETVGMLGATSMQMQDSKTELTLQDVIRGAEIVAGYRSANIVDQRNDPTRSTPWTIEDVITSLQDIAGRDL